MNRTFPPTLPPGVLARLEAYADLFRSDFPLARQADRSLVHPRGLLQDGERTSIEPMVGRVDLPPHLRLKNPDQCLQNFVDQADWDELAVARRYRAHLAETFADPAARLVIDDTTFPKKGEHSVGVKHQCCGALGKRADCQAAVSVHYVAPRGHYPPVMGLYLPEEWAGDAERLEEAHVPEAMRTQRTEGRIALELLDRVRSEGRAGRVVVADAGYGVSGESRDGLAARGRDYVVGVTSELVAFRAEPRWVEPPPSPRGRPATRPRPADDEPRPVSLGQPARELPRQEVTGREGTKGALSGRFGWTRVWPGGGWATGDCVGAAPIWLLIEEEPDGTLKYALSNLSADTPMGRGVATWKGRWPVEQGYQQLKEELGLDHVEGRSWRGFHHHACLVMLALGFLVPERLRVNHIPEKPVPAVPGKKGVAIR